MSNVSTEGIDIPIGGIPRRFHIWASEITMQELLENEKISKKYLYELARGSNKTNMYLDGLLKVALKDEKNSLIYNKLVKEIQQGNKNYQDLIDLMEKSTKTSEKAEQEDKKQNRSMVDAYKDFARRHEDTIFITRRLFQTVVGSLTDISKSLMEGNISGAVESAIGMFGRILRDFSGAIPAALAAVVDVYASSIGMVLRSYEGYASAIANMVNVGAGVGVGLVELRTQSTLLGVSLENFASIITENSAAMLGLGSSVREGSQMFSTLGIQVRDALEQFNRFGLTNTELLQVMAEEIDLRRRSGQSAAQIQNNLADGMNELLLQTTMMANLTGQDRRELLRTRLQRSRDPIVGAFSMQLRSASEEAYQNFNMISTLATERFGQSGTVIADAIQQGLATGRGIEGSPELMQMISLMSSVSPQAADSLRAFAQDVFRQYDTVSPEEFTRLITTGLGNIADEFAGGDLRTLFNVAASDGPMRSVAENLLTFGTSVQGIESDLTTVAEATRELTEAMRGDELLRLPSTIEELSELLKTSLLFTILENLPGIGAFSEENIMGLMDAINNSLRGDDGSVNTLFEAARELSGLSVSQDTIDYLREMSGTLTNIFTLLTAMRALMLANSIANGLGGGLGGGRRGMFRNLFSRQSLGRVTGTFGNMFNTARTAMPNILSGAGNLLRTGGPAAAVGAFTALGSEAISRSQEYAEEIIRLAQQNGISLTEGEMEHLRSRASLTNLSYLRDNIGMLPDFLQEERNRGAIREPIRGGITQSFQGLPVTPLDGGIPPISLTDTIPPLGQNNALGGDISAYLESIANEPPPPPPTPMDPMIRELLDAQEEYTRQTLERLDENNTWLRRLTDAVSSQ